MENKSERKMAKSSLKEEKDAIKKYTKRAKSSKGGVKKVFKHNLSEEKTHAKMLKKYS